MNNTKYDTLMALAHFCNYYHSGQWSKGYRYLCLTRNALQRYYDITYPIDIDLNSAQKRIFNYLVKHYKNKI
jgi:hypothetical protein